MLTGKAKEDFEKWYESQNWDNYGNDIYSILNEQEYEFTDYPFSMQYGVYVDWFDSVGIRLLIHSRWNRPYIYGFDYYHAREAFFPIGMPNKFETRNEARQKAIKKANEIYNSK